MCPSFSEEREQQLLNQAASNVEDIIENPQDAIVKKGHTVKTKSKDNTPQAGTSTGGITPSGRRTFVPQVIDATGDEPISCRY